METLTQYTVVIETLVNASRDIELDNPEIKSYWYEVEAYNSHDAKIEARAIFEKEHPYKAVWDIDTY